MGTSIAEMLRRSNNWILDAVRFAAIWVALADHDLDQSEAAALRAKLPDRQGGLKLDDITQALRHAGGDHHFSDVAHVFGEIRDRLSDDSKETFLRLLIQIAAADGRISQGERHALVFVAELIDCAAMAEDLFRHETGLELYDLADLSDPEYWRQLEENAARARQGSDGGQDAGAGRNNGGASGDEQSRQRAGGASSADPTRVEALATLGLVGTPSLDEIKGAYRRLAKVHHPDRYASLGQDAIAHATRTFQRIQNAYSSLVKQA